VTRALPYRVLVLALDGVERGLVAALSFTLFSNFLAAFLGTGRPIYLALIVSEATVVLFILARRVTPDVSLRPADWLVAVLGTVAPLLAKPADAPSSIPEAVCIMVMLAGFALQIAAKLTLRRSFGAVAANRGVKATGPYRIMRHPMYAGYTITHIGFLLYHPTFWNFGLYAAALTFQILRIRAEERLLRRDEAYLGLAAAVRYRLLPGVF
jgi:protein-S-isoprenylcysteine O-methyltransferase Ste14